MSLASAVVTSIQTKLERFRKLYRILYRDFLFEDFIHKKDVERMFNEIHQRVTTVEANFNAQISAAIASANANIASHIHMVPQSPSGTLPSAPPVFTPVPANTPSQVAVIPWKEPAHITRLQNLIAEGPATAPLADGFDSQVATANVNIRSDIGV